MKFWKTLSILSNILLILILFSGCRYLLNQKGKRMGYEGYFDKNYEWVNTPSSFTPTSMKLKSYDSSFRYIPYNTLLQIQSALDSMIYSRHCYRFVPDQDSSRFFALFVVPAKNPETLAIGRRNTIWVMLNTPHPADSINYIGYVVWGINYNNKWYYLRDEYTSFYKPDIEKAKQYFERKFLYQSCRFFKFYQEENQEEFWNRGGEYLYQGSRSGRFEPVTKERTFDSTHIGLPYAVHIAKIDSVYLDLKRNEYRKENAVIKYISEFIGDEYDSNVIYNEDTSKFLVQIAIPERSHYNLEYYYFDWIKKELFLWTDEPVKQIESLDKLNLYMERDISKRQKVIFALHTHKRPGNFWTIFNSESLKRIYKDSD